MSKRIILVGPTATGKNYIRTKFAEKGYTFDVSYTTRVPREGEMEGIDYKFISGNQFANRVANNAFYEHVEYNGNRYGTGLREWLSCDIFIMETDGIKHIKPGDRKDCFVIFVNTPSAIRKERMLQRGWSDERIFERIAVDLKKFSDFVDYDLQISSETQPF
jgi:guanylate kinase